MLIGICIECVSRECGLMRLVKATGIIIIMVSLFFLYAGSAEELFEVDLQGENLWNGSWVSNDDIIFIQQNSSEISGSYVPKDLVTHDPGLLEGKVSEDGKTFSGKWIDSGVMLLNLSSDNMSFSGIGVIDPVGSMEEPYTYERNGTRNEVPSDPDNLWTGIWTTPKKTYNLTQNGTVITGIHQPISSEEDEPGLFEGTVSEDGRSVTLNWVEEGNFSFNLSEDGSAFTGNYTFTLDPSSESAVWNGTKI